MEPLQRPGEKIKLKSTKAAEGDDEEVENPAFAAWKAQEQQVLSYLLTSISREILVQVAALPSTVDVWKHDICFSVVCSGD
jgi:hypothetical protein